MGRWMNTEVGHQGQDLGAADVEGSLRMMRPHLSMRDEKGPKLYCKLITGGMATDGHAVLNVSDGAGSG